MLSEGLAEMFEGDSADMWAGKFHFMLSYAVSKCGLYMLVNVDVTRCGMPHIEYL